MKHMLLYVASQEIKVHSTDFMHEDHLTSHKTYHFPIFAIGGWCHIDVIEASAESFCYKLRICSLGVCIKLGKSHERHYLFSSWEIYDPFRVLEPKRAL